MYIVDDEKRAENLKISIPKEITKYKVDEKKTKKKATQNNRYYIK